MGLGFWGLGLMWVSGFVFFWGGLRFRINMGLGFEVLEGS